MTSATRDPALTPAARHLPRSHRQSP